MGWLDFLAPALGGLAGGLANRSQNQRTNSSGSSTNQLTPWGQTQGALDAITQGSLGLFGQQFGQGGGYMPNFFGGGQQGQRQGGGGGAGGGGFSYQGGPLGVPGNFPFPGPPSFDPSMNFTPSQYGNQGMMNQGFQQALGGGFGSGMFGQGLQAFMGQQLAGGNPMTNAAFAETQGYRPEYYDQFAQTALNGGWSNPNLDAYIQQRMGDLGGGGDTRARAAMLRASSGGGGGAPRLGEPTNDWHRQLLDGEFLQEGNPYMDSVLDRMQREYRESVVPAISADFARSGRYGSGAYALAQGRANEGLNSSIGDVLFQNYNAERDRMTQGLGMLNSLDQTRLQTEAQRAGTAASAAASMYGTDRNADLQRENMLLNALGMQTDNQQFGLGLGMNAAQSLDNSQLSRLGMMGDLSGLSSNYSLGLLGAGNDFINGQNSALGMGLQGLVSDANSFRNYDANMRGMGADYDLGLRGLQSQYDMGLRDYDLGLQNIGLGLEGLRMQDLASRRSANVARQNQNYQQQRDAFMWEQNRPWELLSNLYGLNVPLATGFGSQSSNWTQQGNTQIPGNPLGGALQGGLGAWLAMQGMGGGG